MNIQTNHDDEWRRHAECSGEDPSIFEATDRAGIESAKKICGSCVVRSECLDFALETNQERFIWGGLTDFERHQVALGERSRDDLSIADEQFISHSPPESTTE